MVRSLKVTSLLAVAVLLSAQWLAAEAQAVSLVRHADSVTVAIGGKPFSTYYFGPNSPKPYLSPLRSATGVIVTRGFPMRTDIPGESHDHPHHRGLFFAHGNINGLDFWGESPPTKKDQTAQGVYYPTSGDLPLGRTVFRKLDKAEGNTVRAEFDLVGPDKKSIGTEIQEFTFRGNSTSRIIDCTVTLVADQGVPLKIGDTKEGTFAIRVATGLQEPNAKMLNSEGKVGEKEIWGKRANWVDYSGKVDGKEVGIAIFDDALNIKHPTYWHARGYGLFAVNPFGEHDFYNDPTRNGGVTVELGKSLTFHYRVLIHEGDADQVHIDADYRLYEERK